jgi:hypothetical protein
MATAASAVSSPTSERTRGPGSLTSSPHASVSTPMGTPLRVTGCHSADTTSRASRAPWTTSGLSRRSETKYGSPEEKTLPAPDGGPVNGRWIWPTRAPATAVETSFCPLGSGS